MNTSQLINSAEWLSLHEHDQIYRVSVTFPPSVSLGRDRDYIMRVPDERALSVIVADFCRIPHTTVTYERIDG